MLSCLSRFHKYEQSGVYVVCVVCILLLCYFSSLLYFVSVVISVALLLVGTSYRAAQRSLLYLDILCTGTKQLDRMLALFQILLQTFFHSAIKC